MVRFLIVLFVWSLRATLRSGGSVALENLALRQQLATYARCHKRPQVKPEERLFWVVLSKAWNGWRSALLMVKPATVIAWHQRLGRRYWRWRSCRPGRPRISDDHIALIRRISSENPQWGEDKIAEELAVKLGVRHSTSTIRKYMVRRVEPRAGQTWKTFIKNHAAQIFAVDFLTQTTAFFAVVYIFDANHVVNRAADSPSIGVTHDLAHPVLATCGAWRVARPRRRSASSRAARYASLDTMLWWNAPRSPTNSPLSMTHSMAGAVSACDSARSGSTHGQRLGCPGS